jgi:succinate dehydrogenase flavin-adding protein (antitoxin of CptAB toxin-antitoxin module)
MSVALPSGSVTAMQKKLFFQASRRSMAEVERILSRFIESELQSLDDQTCHRVLDFLDQPDPDILDWITGVISPPESIDRDVLSRLTRFRIETFP